jgi:glycosyltransferase involved in cell wall biosynthesis
VVARDLGVDEMPGLYRAANAFVLPSRGEGYGRPYLEAMVSGLPVIATRWGGSLDFLNDDNSYLVDCNVVDVSAAGVRDTPDYSGHRWAEPDVDSLRRAMRAVFEDRDEAARRAARGRRTALENHTWEPVADAILARLEAGGVSPLRARLPDSLPVTWEGPSRTAFGIAEVNREIGSALERIQSIDVRQSETATTQPWLWGRPPEVTVRHQWPPDFQPPVAGRLITYQPWEFGSLPSAWIEPMNRQMAEVWVPTTYVRDCFIRSGVDPGKIAVVPYGVDPARFDPAAPPMRLPTKKRHRFLFVGGTIPRKGADILLETYLATFTRRDDVCLVVKDLGAATFYRDQGLGERIKAAQADAASAEIVYIDSDLSAGEMPGLYTACQCLVHPYRGEGFGLPIGEAMACGLAVIVPRHGACLDFCDESVAYLVDAREVRLPEPRIGSIPTVELPWWAEIDRVGLGDAMKRVVNEPAEAKTVGLRASARIRSQWTWDRAGAIAAARLLDVAERPPRLTACVTARGSARGLARCIENLDGFADEIVVVVRDLGGKAAKVAQDHHAKVVQFPGPETPGAARNEGLRHATGDWVLVIEPDEWLDDRGRLEVQGLIGLEGRAAYLALTSSGGADHVDSKERLRVRLFPNHPSLRFSGGRGEALVDGSGAVIAGQETGLVMQDGPPA